MAATLRIRYRKSAIGYSDRQKRTIRALGLKKLNDVVELPDSPSVRGMVGKVTHLVECEEVGEADRGKA